MLASLAVPRFARLPRPRYGPAPLPGRSRAGGSGDELADIFDEVDEEIRGEGRRRLVRRGAAAAAALAMLLLVAVGGWQLWRWRQLQASRAVAGQFLAAMQQADATTPGAREADRTAAAASFAEIARSAPEGYRVLARLREAGLRAAGGDNAAARALWDQVAADAGASALLRDYASLLWVENQVDDGDPAALQARLAPLLAPESAWRPLAEEAQALVQLRSGQDQPGRATLRRLAGDIGAPNGVRQRATVVLQSLGEPAPPGAPRQGAPSGPDGRLPDAGE